MIFVLEPVATQTGSAEIIGNEFYCIASLAKEYSVGQTLFRIIIIYVLKGGVIFYLFTFNSIFQHLTKKSNSLKRLRRIKALHLNKDALLYSFYLWYPVLLSHAYFKYFNNVSCPRILKHRLYPDKSKI